MIFKENENWSNKFTVENNEKKGIEMFWAFKHYHSNRVIKIQFLLLTILKGKGSVLSTYAILILII